MNGKSILVPKNWRTTFSLSMNMCNQNSPRKLNGGGILDFHTWDVSTRVVYFLNRHYEKIDFFAQMKKISKIAKYFRFPKKNLLNTVPIFSDRKKTNFTMSWKRIFLTMQTEITYVLHSFDIRKTNDQQCLLFTTVGLTFQCHIRYVCGYSQNHLPTRRY